MIGSVLKVVDSRKPWLIVGKGPTALRSVDFSGYNVLTLNHACRIPPNADLALFMDIEAFYACLPYLIDSKIKVVLPWVPHENMRPSKHNLAHFVSENKLLSNIYSEERLFSFNSTTVPPAHHAAFLPVIRVRYFVAVAAVNILAAAGQRTVYTLGVDGGKEYAEGFDKSDLLKNGRGSFDIQFAEFARTKNEVGLELIRL